MSIPNITLNNDIAMPQLGFGVFKVPSGDTAKIVTTALEAGYRSIDTATLYGNEDGVGQAIATSGIPRDELFVTTKLWNTDQGYDSALRAFDISMKNLGLDYLDLYLIHWPVPSQDQYVQTWRALERLYADGRVRAIGVSNFQPDHLRRLAAESGITPVVNQVELHPYLTQETLRAYHAEHGIATEAWAPLAKGRELMSDPVIESLARTHGRTPAQIVLRWHLQRGTIAIPKSVTPSRIAENLDVFGFSLGDSEMADITGLDRGGRTGPEPDTM